MQETPFQSELSLQATRPNGGNPAEKLPPPSSPATTNNHTEPATLESLATLHSSIASTPTEQQTAWEAKRKEIDQITDALGLGIDEGIKETVVAFNMLGLHTSGSCEGHLEHGLLTPWIDVEAPGRPDTQFVREMEVFQRVASKYGVPLEHMRRGGIIDAWWEARDESAKNGYTPEFLQFLEETHQLTRKLGSLVEEFNAGRDMAPGISLHVDTITSSSVRLWGGDAETHFSGREDRLPHAERSTLLTQRQAEMSTFTTFLRAKYFSASTSNQ